MLNWLELIGRVGAGRRSRLLCRLCCVHQPAAGRKEKRFFWLRNFAVCVLFVPWNFIRWRKFAPDCQEFRLNYAVNSVERSRAMMTKSRARKMKTVSRWAEKMRKTWRTFIIWHFASKYYSQKPAKNKIQGDFQFQLQNNFLFGEEDKK